MKFNDFVRLFYCLLIVLNFLAHSESLAEPLSWGKQSDGDMLHNDGQKISCYAPGIIRADQGTVRCLSTPSPQRTAQESSTTSPPLEVQRRGTGLILLLAVHAPGHCETLSLSAQSAERHADLNTVVFIENHTHKRQLSKI